jgi:exonuclease SbcC
LDTFQGSLESEREAYRRRSTRIKDHQERMTSIKETVSSLDRELLKRAGLQRKEAALAIAVEEGARAQEALPAAQEVLEALERQLQEGAYALEDQDALRQVERQLAELGYDADEHRRIRDELGTLRSSEDDMQTLRDARSSVETVRLAISQLHRSRSEINKQLSMDRAQAEELNRVVAQLPDLRRRTSEARQALEEAHDREQQASLSLGAARNKLEHCADLRRHRVKRVQEEQQQREEQAIYQELQGAFGKNGVQAMLIESAIPEIEQEANQLLARMTRGTMHVLFDTQRDTKKGTTIETLDIYITDQLGTRSYETYSGGERYRIDFAIRMALSKLLTRRAGAQLQMLVIDEGFGTQDSEGRDGLIDAIHAVSEDFACILAVTHIDELKDAFSVRIEVTKTPEGSQIAIN